MSGLKSSIRPEGTRRSASRSVVSGEHSKAPPTTPLARETSSDKVFQAGKQRLKPSSGTLITPPTCRTDLVYHRDHLKYVMGERAGHWNDVRATYAPVTSSHRRRREVLRLPSGERLVRTRVWSGVGSPPAKVRAKLTHPARLYVQITTGWYHVNYRAGSSQSRY